MCLLLGLNSCSTSEAPLIAAETPAIIEDQLIDGEYNVIFRSSSIERSAIFDLEKPLDLKQSLMSEEARAMLLEAGVDRPDFNYVFVNALKGVSLFLTAEQAGLLSRSAAVSHLQLVRTMSIPGTVEVSPEDGGGEGNEEFDPAQMRITQALPWGIRRVGGVQDGTGKVAWILDTGIDPDHPDLNVDTDRAVSFIAGETYDDGFGHGTHVAGTVAAIDNDFGVVGVAAGATVVPVKVLSNLGFGSDAAVIGGIDYALQYHETGDVANMSLGGSASIVLDNAVINAADQGLRFCIAAGNGNIFGIAQNANTVSPARVNHENVLTISAMNKFSGITIFSNFSPTIIDYAAPGVFIASCYKNGGYRVFAGTSQATPHVAGLWLMGDIQPQRRLLYDWDSNRDWIAHR
jgi:subtilisin family serine protease